MVDHTFLGEGIVLVEYDTGTQIIINYNDFAVTVGSIVVAAEGYEVIS